MQKAIAKPQQSVFKTYSKGKGAGNPDHPNPFRIMLIRARIQDPRSPKGLARESWILDPGPNQNNSELIRMIREVAGSKIS